MIGVTIGIGNGWKECAEITAAKVGELCGVKTHVISERPAGVEHELNPSWVKCKVAELFPREDCFMVFDADWLPLRAWNPAAVFHFYNREFCAVAEGPNNEIDQECINHGLPFPGWYVNGGLTIFGREHQPVWDRVWNHRPSFGRWLEQTALNESLYFHQTKIHRMPYSHNAVMWPQRDSYDGADIAKRKDVAAHATSLGGRANRLRKIQQELWGI